MNKKKRIIIPVGGMTQKRVRSDCDVVKWMYKGRWKKK